MKDVFPMTNDVKNDQTGYLFFNTVEKIDLKMFNDINYLILDT